MELVYDYPLYRPPSESQSLIFQVTLGCSFNKCSFCNMYRTKAYSERSIDEIDKEIDLMANYYPETKRIFLADGDALNLETIKLIHILSTIRKKFNHLERISSYSMPKNLLEKSHDELESLKKAGLDMVYLGIESGNNTVLKKVTKGATSKMIVDSCKKAKDTGFILSCMIILGLGGKNYSKVHAEDTAKIINEIEPDYIGALTLYMEPGVEKEFYTKFKEPFIPLDDLDILDELNRLINGISVSYKLIFRANHASNVYSIGGTLPKDKQDILQKIGYLKEHPELLKPKMLRRF
ncbi:radical SAM protein [Candidatus Nitrosocosmicus arcticus]|uniref:Radical SAM domain protein n=1 Tax=Candidatus Nitrosocosmicus arcticus TaxID=2035267 RepID=A0A557SSQ5_9ARCH|nr:radical SAM protein [Candidatus Nitrosocosmicus arcticus]TVP39641.1 Radical SAM domain protein [Candidatus Nitrosocosmicus arcticus]